MALIRSPLQKQEDELDEQGNPLAQGGPGGGAPVSSAGPTQPAAAPTTKPSQGGGFVNLMDYVKANEGRGAQMADKLDDSTQAKEQTYHQANAQRPAEPPKAWGQPQAGIQQDPNAFNSLIDYLGHQGERADEVGKEYGSLADENERKAMLQEQQQGQYSGGEADLDNFLTGQAGTGAWQQRAQQYGTAAKAASEERQSYVDRQEGARQSVAEQKKLDDAQAVENQRVAEQKKTDDAFAAMSSQQADLETKAWWKQNSKHFTHRPTNAELKALLGTNVPYALAGQSTLPESTQERMTDEEVATLAGMWGNPNPAAIGAYIEHMIEKYGIHTSSNMPDEYPEDGGAGAVAIGTDDYEWLNYGD